MFYDFFCDILFTMNKNALTDFQRNEITEHIVYNILAKQDKSSNSEILAKISREEMAHYEKIRSLTKTEIKPNWFKVFWYVALAKILGLTFALKLMERGEEKAQRAYSLAEENIFTELIADEKTHEDELLRLIDEEKLDYIGSMVLGLNDALVELTGALAGLTLAIQKNFYCSSLRYYNWYSSCSFDGCI